METFSTKSYKIALFEQYFAPLKDARRLTKGNLRHPLLEILFLTLASVISGCNTWEEIEHFGEMKLEWFRKFYPYKYGTASDDTLGAVFSSLEPGEFGKCFMEYTQSLAKKDSRVVAIDGKTVRGVASDYGNSPLHIVSAFCQENRLCLSQQKVEGKSNEITAIPLLLDMLTLDGCIVTIDAMGCQKEIATKIIERKADYILQVKDNQKQLHKHIERLFEITALKDTNTTHDLGHGRMEKRICRVINDLTFLDQKPDWKGIKSIVEIESEVENKKTGVKSHSKRHYISSLDTSAAETALAIRQHWSIENNLHWNLDVIFKEDNQLKRKGNAVENFNLVTKICLGLLEAEKSKKRSKNLKRHRAILSDSYRETLLNL